MLKKTISMLCAAGILAGCASPTTRAELDFAQTTCLGQQNAEACASVPALQAQANAEANENGWKTVAVIALLPLYILAAAAGADLDNDHPHYHYHYHR